jgi:hypothetical protein
MFGSDVENELNSVEGKTSNEINQKRQAVLRKKLGLQPKFRNPTITKR